MPSSRLREATTARDSLEPDVATTARSTRQKPRKSYVMESGSDEDDEEDDEDVEGEDEMMDSDNMDVDEAAGSDQDDLLDDSLDDDDDDDEDVDMDEDADDGIPLGAPVPTPPAPSLKINGPAAPQPPPPRQPKVTLTPVKEAKSRPGTALKSVEDREMELDDEDEELSELGSDDAEDDEGEDEDAEGEEDDELDDEALEGRSIDTGSRASTPDITKLTKRQRSRLDQVIGNDFLQLPMGKRTPVYSSHPFSRTHHPQVYYEAN